MKCDSFEIAMLIKEIYSNTVNIISDNLKDSGLTYQQIMVIKLIAHNGQVNISKICDEMSLSKGTVSGIVTRLESLGYINKIKDPNDKRNTYIEFSKKGIEFAKEFKKTINDSFENVFENFTDEELANLKENLIFTKNKIKR
ncbi:MarR family winged helix-turn-helix transcriptional regulator [Clostridium sp.]|uniref:MarR family winged helix-turn-helix transcriptional regulator n=1 Tax=Clostridium sp. TaxID=1506 RepID=UPI0026DB5D47|nr:MarR family transcriptional regulator [Clostridium sp.]MDO5039334.1 MarR family transcriptional regulator [Clostridium sp.]